MNRRDLIKLAATGTALGALPASSISASSQPAQPSATSGSGVVTLQNAVFDLEISLKPGLNCRLVHRASGRLLADGPYSYSFEISQLAVKQKSDDTVILSGSSLIGLSIEHRFKMDASGSFLEEEIELTNHSRVPIDLGAVRCGFVMPIAMQAGRATGPWSRHTFTAIPFRREPLGGKTQYSDFSLDQVLTGQHSSELWTFDTTVTSSFASEAWAWTDGVVGLLFSKYSPKGIEFALLDRVPLPEDRIGLRWGGMGVYRGNPEYGAWLRPGSSHRFGVTRLTAFSGDWMQGYYAFRGEMENRDHGCPEDFNPPVHWNELYDNKLWWLPNDGQDDPRMRKEYYTLASMKEEAAKAKEIGCEALYMDPGWDTNFGSKIWDDSRLGSYESFVAMLARDYGLKSSLHTPLSGWCDPTSYPVETLKMDRYGQRLLWTRAQGFWGSTLCGASEQYVKETSERLKRLARGGAAYFMFDGTPYHSECWDTNHGHPVPARLDAHVDAMCRLARMVHAEYPHVLIEMHDPGNGGQPLRTVPIYYGHGPGPAGEPYSHAAGFDSVWAFELMWMPMEDLLSGHSIALYYYNLAYSLPLYIHIDLRTDNRNAIVFWWNASTCRHLGIGGTHLDAAVRLAQKTSMTTYMRLKRYFTAGAFYGIDEMTHVHSVHESGSAVMNCFNLDEKPVEREIRFEPERLGLPADKTYRFSAGEFRRTGSGYLGKVQITGIGHTLIEVMS